LQQLATVGGHVATKCRRCARGAEFVITMLRRESMLREVWQHQGGLIEAVRGKSRC